MGMEVKATVKNFTAESKGEDQLQHVFSNSVALQLIILIITSGKAVPNERATRAVYRR